jgi:transcriptional regulator with XRE-family HTH domain
MKIREYLDASGFTLPQMSEALKVHEQYLWSLSKGRANPSARLAKKICEWSEGKIKVHHIRKCTRTCEDGCACSRGK